MSDQLRTALARLSLAATLLALGIGVFGLVGWTFEIALLRTVIPGEVPIAPSTCVSFVALAGAALLLGPHRAAASRARAVSGRLLAALAALVGVANLGWQLMHLARGHWGPWPIPTVVEPLRGLRRMDFIAALDIVMIGLGLLLLDWRVELRSRRYWPTHALVFCSGMAALVGLLDFVLGSALSYTHVALPTAVGLVALSFGVLAARSEYGLGALLVSDTVGGYLTRRLWPAAVIVPMLLGMVSWRIHSAGIFSEWASLATLISSMIVLLGALVVWNGQRIDRTDRSRLNAESALHRRETELQEAHRLARLGSWFWVPSTNQVTWSPELYRIARRDQRDPPPALRDHAQLFIPESAERLRAAFEAALVAGTSFELDLQLVSSGEDARYVIARGEVERDSAGGIRLMRGTVQDVTQSRIGQLELARVHRAQQALSRSNQALVRAVDPASLLEQVCEIVVATAGYRFCWVGRAEFEPRLSVHPVAHAGEDSGYLQAASASWADSASSQAPVAQCIRLRQIVVGGGSSKDLVTTALPPATLDRGFSSCLAIPIVVRGAVFGALEILSAEPDAFGPREVELLLELAEDLAFGIETLETKAAHLRAEEEVRALNAALEQRVSSRTAELSAANEAKDRLLLQQQATSVELALSRQREAEVGFRIQQTLLLDAPPCDIPGLRVAARTLPSQSADGDFYAFITTRDQVLDVIVGDVMGKGVVAALLGAATKSHLSRALSDLACACDRRSPIEPRDVVMLAHAGIARHLIDLGSFVTLCYARLHASERRLEFVDCGNTGILVLDASTGLTRVLHGENLPLGVREGEVYRQHSALLAPGDTLLLFSDGITDARDAAGQVFGLERLERVVQQHAALDPDGLIEAVTRAVQEFSGGGAPSDDQTSVVIRIDETALPLRHEETEIRSALCELARIRQFIRAFCQDAPGQPLDAVGVDELELAVNEAASNVMKHAYGGESDQLLRIDADAFPDRVSVRLRHVGSSFEPEGVPEPEFNGTRESGFGTFIIASSVDEVRYYRDSSGRNCVALVKKRRQPAGGAPRWT